MKIKKCPDCTGYTMRETCTRCKAKTVIAKPAKFSPEDKYGKYRRMLIMNSCGIQDTKILRILREEEIQDG
ncbi:MAG: hypothetical protein MSIBF_03610 [Candidatus Altiarchaeales archaeon IMC4]|nr:MAG: hypothetical protein MSIBF_03610 [Candidatus Altiarchaeales archaeon IMC4]